MTADGVLQGGAKKIYRGTIDFKNGSAGAIGDEKETVLLLSDDVVNQTIPLILCSEEDGAGNHGASIGKLDDELLFYLCSRGFSEQEAVDMMAKAKIDALCRKIDDEDTVQLVQRYLEGVMQMVNDKDLLSFDYKKDFPLLAANDVAYLDNSATTQKPACVIEAERDFYLKHNANPLRGLYDLAMQATDIYEDARVAVQKFINAKSEQEIIFTRNTTESLNLVAYSYGLANLKPGDEIVTTIMEHHSNLLPWQMVCRQTGAELKFLECDQTGFLSDETLENAITDKTRLVAIAQVSNVLGRTAPIEKIVKLARKHGAAVVMDAARARPTCRSM